MSGPGGAGRRNEVPRREVESAGGEWRRGALWGGGGGGGGGGVNDQIKLLLELLNQRCCFAVGN